MRVHIVARKLKITDAIKDFIEARFSKLGEYLDNIVWAQAMVGVEKKIYTAEVIVHAGHQTMKASAQSDDLYCAIDKVMAKMEIQVKKYKERHAEHRGRETDYSGFAAPAGPEIRFSVVKDVPVKAQGREDAVAEMEKLGYNFWLFMDKQSKQMRVVFKRLDGTYGLLQPVKKIK